MFKTRPPFEEFVRMRKVMRCPLFRPLLLHWRQNSSWLEWRLEYSAVVDFADWVKFNAQRTEGDLALGLYVERAQVTKQGLQKVAVEI
ncbi:hypothetical protein HanHA89_Chr04g0137381 [Helianthus annuus]|nr:hypothetical protein HanHA89_Chr04g0137381 [Helianthus annuus]